MSVTLGLDSAADLEQISQHFEDSWRRGDFTLQGIIALYFRSVGDSVCVCLCTNR